MDLFITHEGDLALSSTGRDLQHVQGADEVLQAIAMRMKTTQGACSLWPDLGNTLHQLIGEFMSQTTLDRTRNLVYYSLQDCALAAEAEIEVRVSQVNDTEALIVIFVNFYGKDEIYTIPFDYKKGIVLPRSTTAPIPAIGAQALEY